MSKSKSLIDNINAVGAEQKARSARRGRPAGSCKPESERRVSLTIRVLPDVYDNIKKLPKGHLRELVERTYSSK